MSTGKASQDAIETLLAIPSPPGKVSQEVVEVLVDRPTPTNILSGTDIALGTYGDECNTTDLDAAWTLRNIASVTGDGTKYSITLDASGDAMTREITDPVSITAIEEYNASYAAWKAMDGSTGTDWAAVGWSANDWWKIEWATAQTLSSIRMQCRDGGETIGSGHLEFSSGANVAFSALVSGISSTITFSERSTTFVKIVSEVGGSGNAGLKEVSFPDQRITTSLNVVAHLAGLTDIAGMVGVMAVDANGSGIGAASYSNRFNAWILSTYSFSNDAGTEIGRAFAPEHWVHLRRSGTIWYARYSHDGTQWTGWTSGYADGRQITKIGVGRFYGAGSSQTLGLERFIWSSSDIQFVNFSGVLVCQDALEVLVKPQPVVRVSQDAIEVLKAMPPGMGPPVGGTFGYGHGG
jgi:hypothetical protein